MTAIATVRKEIGEWESITLPGLQLSPQDRALAQSLSGESSRRLAIDELREGLRISAKSWVGVVRFSAFELHIRPKLTGSTQNLLELIDYATGWDSLDRHPAEREFAGGDPNLLELIALLLAEACERLLRGGLLADYRELDDDLPVLRGRLRVGDQVLRRFGRVDRLECRFDEHGTDIPENQLLLAALAACATRVRHPDVALRVRRVAAVLHEAASLDGVELQSLKSGLMYNRLNSHYRPAHGLAWLLLEGLGVADLYSGGEHRSFAFLLDMNRLFEDFVGRWLTALLEKGGFRVRTQRRDRTILWDAERNEPYRSVIPDLLIECPSQSKWQLAVDAKYKLYENKRVASSDIYQTFLYAFAYGQHHGPIPTALLIYPTSSLLPGSERLQVRRTQGLPHAELKCLGIHLPSALKEARSGVPGTASEAVRGAVKQAMST